MSFFANFDPKGPKSLLLIKFSKKTVTFAILCISLKRREAAAAASSMAIHRAVSNSILAVGRSVGPRHHHHSTTSAAASEVAALDNKK